MAASAPRNARTQALSQPLRTFLATEVGSTTVLLGATAVALIWANLPFGDTYAAVWQTPLRIAVGGAELNLDLQHWINDGLMALFFFVIGMELSLELTRGRLRDRRQIAVPALAALGGMVVPAGLYLAFNAGGAGQPGWAIPIATDTAFALGLLAVVGPRCPDPLRLFLLTLAVVDDIGAILVIAAVYTRDVSLAPLLAAAGLFGLVVVVRRLRVHNPLVYWVLAVAIWLATLRSGLHPTVAGIAMGLLARAYTPPDTHILRVGELVREFTRRPTPERARSVSRSVRDAVSPNERLQLLFHPWTSYLVLPLFALANAGIQLRPGTLAQAATSPVTWGIITGLVVGKLAGVCLGSWVGLRSRLGVLPGNLVWGQLTGGAAVAGIGFTLSLFVTDLAFTDETVIADAKIGVLAGSLLAALTGWTIFRLAWNRGAVCAPPPEPGAPPDQELPDTLTETVSGRDHVRGPDDAPVTLVEYGDYECPECGRAYPVIDTLRERFGDDLRFVFRNYPLPQVHPNAWPAALAAEAAAAYDRFWEMHDRLFTHQRELEPPDLATHAEHIGLSGGDVVGDAARPYADRVDADIESGRHSGVRGTPTFFVNGRRHRGGYDLESLAAAIEDAT